MSGPRKTLDELIAEALERQERSRADVADLRTRQRDLERKRATRKKIVLGAGVQILVKMDSELRELLAKRLPAVITRPWDRALLPELFSDDAPADVHPARPLKDPGESPSGAAPS
jgi:hypothetical protein